MIRPRAAGGTRDGRYAVASHHHGWHGVMAERGNDNASGARHPNHEPPGPTNLKESAMFLPSVLTVRAADADTDVEATVDGTDVRVDVLTDGLTTRLVLNPAQASSLLGELTTALQRLGVVEVAA